MLIGVVVFVKALFVARKLKQVPVARGGDAELLL